MGYVRRFGVVALLAVVVGCGGTSFSGGAGPDAQASDAGGVKASGTIGAAGGVVSLGAASITIPPGALSKATDITISIRSDFPPAQYATYSPFYEFDPHGLTFALPATVVLPRYTGPASEAMYWSAASGTGYDRLATTLAAHAATAQVTHFSNGFVGTPAATDGGGTGTPDGGHDATTHPDARADGSMSGGHDAAADVAADARDRGTTGARRWTRGGADAGGDAGAADAAPLCVIGGVSYVDGAVNPSDACQVCQVSASTSSWTSVLDGTTCGAGELCGAGTCAPQCEIGGALVAPGAANPSNACETCVPATSTTAWTPTSGGAVCGGVCVLEGSDPANCGGCGNVCPAATPTCASGTCVVCPGTEVVCNGACVDEASDGQNCGGCGNVCGTAATCTNGTCLCPEAGGTSVSCVAPNGCCQDSNSAGVPTGPAVCTDMATDYQNCGKCNNVCPGLGYRLCCAGVCEIDIDPSTCNSCSVSCTNSPYTACSATGSGCYIPGTSPTSGEGPGAHATECNIQGTVYASGASNPANPCQVCDIATPQGWSTGGTCPGGQCNGFFCVTSCTIGGVFYTGGTVNPTNPCQSCQAGVSGTAWTDVTDGTSCGAGLSCIAGVCG